MRSTLLCLSTSILVMLGGCATTYQPLKVDSATGMYSTTTKVDPGGIQVFLTTSDPTSYPVILLTAESNYSSSKFEFMVRTVLAQAGITAVYNPTEFRNFVADRHFEVAGNSLSAEAVEKFSKTVAPVLVINSKYTMSGNAWVRVELQVQDAQSGQVLLRVDHNRMVWVSFDSEALYPVLNQLREWIKQSARSQATKQGSST